MSEDNTTIVGMPADPAARRSATPHADPDAKRSRPPTATGKSTRPPTNIQAGKGTLYLYVSRTVQDSKRVEPILNQRSKLTVALDPPQPRSRTTRQHCLMRNTRPIVPIGCRVSYKLTTDRRWRSPQLVAIDRAERSERVPSARTRRSCCDTGAAGDS